MQWAVWQASSRGLCASICFFFFYWAMNLVLWTSEFISYINVSFICPLLQRMLDAHSAFGNYQWTTIFFFPSSLHFRCILPFISITLWWYIFNIEFVGLAPLYSLKYFESLIRFIKITVASITRAVSRWWHKSRLMDLWKIPRTFRSNVISRGIFMRMAKTNQLNINLAVNRLEMNIDYKSIHFASA